MRFAALVAGLVLQGALVGCRDAPVQLDYAPGPPGAPDVSGPPVQGDDDDDGGVRDPDVGLGGQIAALCGGVQSDRARDILGERCGSCHGLGVAPDRDRLVADGWVVPFDVAASTLFTKVELDVMPLGSGGGPLNAEEKDALSDWIRCGAEAWPDAPTRGFLAPEMEFEAAFHDLVVLDSDAHVDIRYLSLVALYNAGVPADRITLYASGLSKLVWSLTVESNPPMLVPVDLDGTTLDDGSVVRVAEGLGKSLLFRVDLADFGWDVAPVDVWEELVKLYPFATPYDDQFDAAEDIVALTRTRVPIVRGDWFEANASVPPLYTDVLDLPDTVEGFFARFGGIEAGAAFDDDSVQCAGIDGPTSLVSPSNRASCRFDTVDGYCWETFDFATSAGAQDLFVNPTTFREASDGGEAFCQLGDGQQVYFVRDASGQRLDVAPTDLVVDYAGAAITNGLSCMGCHTVGVQAVTDQVLGTVLGAPASYTDEVLDQVVEWYPASADLALVVADDIDSFQAALDALDVLALEEPIQATAIDHQTDLDAKRVAAELGLPSGALAERLAADPAILALYATLYDGVTNTIPRDDFALSARDTICTLELGDPCDPAAFCGLSAVPCPNGSTCDALGQCSRVP